MRAVLSPAAGVSRWQSQRREFYTACTISGRGEIHDAVSACIELVMKAMVRASEGPSAKRYLRMQYARTEYPENSLHNTPQVCSADRDAVPSRPGTRLRMVTRRAGISSE
jgi:hypothetical protein